MQRREPFQDRPRMRRAANTDAARDEWAEPDEDRASYGLGWQLRRVFGALCLRFVMPVVLLLVLAVGGGYFRLLQGPASLKFLVGPVERGISAELNGIVPKIDDVVVTLGDGGGLEFQLVNLRLYESGVDDGELLAAAPSAAMQVSPSALWSARIVPSRVEFIEPKLFLAYSRADGLTLKFSQAAQDKRTLESLKGPPRRAELSSRDSEDKGVTTGPSDGWSAKVEPAGEPEGVVSDEPAQAATQRIDLAKMFSEASARARAGDNVSSYLREIGFRDATVVLDNEGRQSSWEVPRVSMVFDHGSSGSTVSGEASVTSRRGPWGFSFRLEDVVDANAFALKLAVQGLVPRTLGEVLPKLGLLRPLDLPVDGEADLSFSRSGELSRGRIALQAGKGNLQLSPLSMVPLVVESGVLNVTFDGQTQKFVMEPSTLRWGESTLTLVGVATVDQAGLGAGNEDALWRFDVSAQQGQLSDSGLGLAPIAIDQWSAVGSLLPSRSIVALDSLNIVAGGGQVTLSGEFDSSVATPGVRLEGKLASMPVATLAMLWPQGMADGGRSWVGRRISGGQITSGTMKYLSGRHLSVAQPGDAIDYRFALAAELADVSARLSDTAPEIRIPRALVRLENTTLEVVAPNVSVVASSDHIVQLTQARFTAVDLDQPQGVGELAFKVDSAARPVFALLGHPSLGLFEDGEPPFKGLSGKVAGDLRLAFPVSQNTEGKDVKVGGKLRLTDGRAKHVFAKHDIQGATLDIDVAENAVGAHGEVLISGVLAKVNWQHIFGAQQDQQPPLRLTASLDNSDRKQLGIALDDAVQGTVPVEITITPNAQGGNGVHVHADVTNADIYFDAVAWHKGPGRSAHLDFDLEDGTRYPTMLSNLKLAGDDMAIEGWAGMDEGGKIVAFEFPKFSLDLVSRLKVSGRRKGKHIWSIVADGPTYDGRAFFTSLFSVGRLAGRPQREVGGDEGINLRANIGNVLGFEDVALKDVSLKVSKRGGKLTGLKVDGTLPSGEPMRVRFREKAGTPRLLIADTPDAGNVFRLVGFYPNLRGGKMRLEVQLDGRGAAEKTGTLRVDKFQILGDAVVSEVFSNAEDGRPSIAAGTRGTRRVVQEVFPFDRMRVPFSVGHGQFVMNDASLQGPLLGATVRGKVDYLSRTLDIGGTYVPLQGINNVFGPIPLLGELLSGPNKEGIFGMTFAIQGAMGRPQVLVNPFSFVAPGILREIFQLTPYDPRVQPRKDPKKGARSNWDVRSSSAPAAARQRAAGTLDKGIVGDRAVDGWSARATRE